MAKVKAEAEQRQSEMIDTATAAEILGMKEQTLRSWRSRKIGGPQYYKISDRRVRYKRNEVEEFRDGSRVVPLSLE